MQLSKTQLTHALQYVSKGDNRYALQGIKVTPSRVMATNGHFLSITENCLDCKDASFDVILASDSVKNALRVWPKKQDWLDVDVEETKKNGHLKFQDSSMPTIEKIDGQFPNVDQVIPKEPPTYRTYIAPALLETIGKSLKGREPLCFEFPNNPMTPIRITQGQTVIVLMPANGNTKEKVGPLPQDSKS